MNGPRPVSFPSGDLALRGYLWRPDGDGPVPAIVWNHGSERRPAVPHELAEFYASAGYAFFAPHRRGHGESAGEYPLAGLREQALVEAQGYAGYRRKAIELLIEMHDAYLEDTIAAVGWLAEQPFVDPARMAMSGVSHGGIQTILAAGADVGTRAYVPFAPAALAWRGNPELHDFLLRAARTAKAPIFLIQAKNDFSLGPSQVLGQELRRKGHPNRARVYPPYGRDNESGHAAFACRGTDVWGSDVRVFLDEALNHSAVVA
jgi:carboxymethylenebutenolidase